MQAARRLALGALEFSGTSAAQLLRPAAASAPASAQVGSRVFRTCTASSQGGAGGRATLEQLTREAQSDKSKHLFKKVLESPVPAEEVRAGEHAPPPALAWRVAGYLGNFVFYGALLAGVAFGASTFTTSDADVREAAEAARRRAAGADAGPLERGAAVALSKFEEARAWYRQKVVEFTDPPSDALLPEQLPMHRAAGVRTLVLDLDEVLVKSVWHREHGWKTYKRNCASDFLERLAECYELVVFTDRPHSYADPILNRVDPGIASNTGPAIIYRLYKNATHWKGNQSVRDLTKLNRDLARVVFVVAASKAGSVEPADNVLVIPDMDPDDSDEHTLSDLVPLLELLVLRGVPDTRAVCRAYAGVTDVAAEFRRRVGPQEAAPRRRRFFGGGGG